MFFRIRINICSTETEDPSLKDSRSDETSENRLNNNLVDLVIMSKIE